MRVFELTTLGRVSLTNPAGAVVATLLAQPKRLGVLVYLAVAAPNDLVRRDVLCELFWPDAPPDRARSSLRQALAFLRRALGEDAIITRGDDEVGLDATRVRCDAVLLRTQLMTRDPERAEVFALYTGPFMLGFVIDDVPRFDRWIEDARSAFTRDVGETAIDLARASLTVGEASAVMWAQRACDVLPFDERALVVLLQALDASGDQSGALRSYDLFVRQLAESLEVEPAPETVAVAQAIRTRAALAQRVSEPAEHGLPDGEVIAPARLQPAPIEQLPLTATIASVQTTSGALVEPATSRHRWRWAFAVAVVVVAVSWFARPSERGDTLPSRSAVTGRLSTAGERVLVAPFVNETGDSTLDAVGRMAADWITEGFSRIDGVAVVPGTTLLAMERARRAVDGGVPVRLDAMAQETGATLVVSGTYYRTGGTLHLQARFSDASLSTLLRPVETVSVSTDSIAAGVATIRERVLANMAPLLDSTTHFRFASTPPSYEAYSDFLRGFERFVEGDPVAALTLFERAAEADTTYRMAQLAAAITQSNLGDMRGAFLRVRALKQARERFGPVEQGTLDMIDGMLRGDVPAIYAAVSRTARITPGSIVEYMVAESARRLNRPQEALRVLRGLHPERGELRGWSDYWREMGYALHMRGEYAGVLAMVQAAKVRYPASAELLAAEVRALTALSRLDSVNRLLAATDVRPGPLRDRVGAMYRLAAGECVRRGDTACAAESARRAVVWYQAAANRARIAGHARALRLAGEPESAWRVLLPFSDTVSAGTSSLGDLGLTDAQDVRILMRDLGVLAVLRGDTAAATRWDLRIAKRQGSLEEPLRGSQWAGLQLDRAAIAAQRGELDRAITLLREALARGLSYWPGLAADIDLAPLHDHPAWRAMMQPAG